MSYGKGDRLVVGIAGGTGSGKSTVGRKIIDAVGTHHIACLDQDSYYRDLGHLDREERRKKNFDHPDAIEFSLFYQHIQDLRDGRSVEKPIYSFTQSTRTGEYTTVEPADIILAEGILILSDEKLRSIMDIKLFVDADDDIRLIRRTTRDIQDRGRSFDQVVSQYLGTVRPMHLTFVEPSKRYADIIIPGGGMNEVAVAMIAATLRDWVTAKAARTNQGPGKSARNQIP